MGETATLEAVGEQERTSDARSKRRLRLPWPRRIKKDPHAAQDAALEVESEPPPLAYKTFSPNIAPALTAIGGVLALLGGLGTWVRATELQSEGTIPQQVAVTMGYNDPEGQTIAVLGGIALLASVAWLRQRPLFNRIPTLFVKIIPVIASVAVVALAAWQLPLIDQEAQRLALEARSRVDFAAYHAGFGWGAWCLLVAALSLAVGTFIGVLREFDVRKGYGETSEAARGRGFPESADRGHL